MQRKIKLITDSASDLPIDLQKQYAVDVVPLTVNFGHDEYKDGVTITAQEFWEKLKASPELPSTSQVNPHEFVEVFTHYIDSGYDILYVGIAGKLSGTIQSALMAKETLQTDRIHVFDSRSASLGESLLVVKAADMLEKGMELPDVIQQLENEREQSLCYIMLDSLDHVVRGGRLTKTQAFFGTIMNIKPLITFTTEGTVEVAEKVRSTKKALQSMIDKAKQQCSDFSDKTIAIVHTHAAEALQEFEDMVEEELSPGRIISGLVGPTIGTHAGPGGVGLFL